MDGYTILGILLVAAAAYTFTRGRKKSARPPPAVAGMPDWRTGPVINGENYSRGTPARPVAIDSGWALDIPLLPGHVNYVQRFGGAAPRGGLRVRYRVDGGGILQCENGQAATAGLMLQRKGDNFSGRGKYAGYRWFARMHLPLTEGDHDYAVPLDAASWGATVSDPQAASFAACLANFDNLSIVFGGTGGRGHGVYATGQARFTLHAIEPI